jgi:acetoin:2,6-dichlorophenolindophenol oxidoreductase subunit beta
MVRVATPDMRIPAAPVLMQALLPSAAKVVEETKRLVAR